MTEPRIELRTDPLDRVEDRRSRPMPVTELSRDIDGTMGCRTTTESEGKAKEMFSELPES